MAKICILEDERAIRDELAELLGRRGFKVSAVAEFGPDAATTASAVCAEAPDLVLLDLTLPGADGLLIARELRRVSDVPLICVTSRTSEVDEVMAMDLGADGYIAKPYRPAVLVAHIEALLRRANAGGGHRILTHNGLTLDVDASRATTEGGEVTLSPNECRILSTLMQHAGAVVSRSALMVELWSSDAFVDDNTLTVNVNRLRSSLASIGVTGYLTTHRGRGYGV